MGRLPVPRALARALPLLVLLPLACAYQDFDLYEVFHALSAVFGADHAA